MTNTPQDRIDAAWKKFQTAMAGIQKQTRALKKKAVTENDQESVENIRKQLEQQ